MSTSISISFTIASFPVGWTGNYDQFAQKLVSLLTAQIQGNIMPGLYSQGVVTLPTSDQGPIFMGGQLYLWNVTTGAYALYTPNSPVTQSYNVLDNGDFQVWQRNYQGTSVNVGPDQWWGTTFSWTVDSGGAFTIPAVGSTVNVHVVSSGGAVPGSDFYPGNNVVCPNGDELSITAVPDGTHITFTNTGGATAGDNVGNNAILRVRQKCYLADRWAVIQDGTITTPPSQQLAMAGILGGRSNNNPNTLNCLRVIANAASVTPTSGQYCIIVQRIERQRAQLLFDFTPSLSLWIRSSVSGTFCAFLQSAGGDRSIVFPCTVTGGGTGSWKQYPFPAIPALPYNSGTWGTDPTDFSMLFGICISCGSNFQQSPSNDKQWQVGTVYGDTNQANLLATGLATFDICLAQLEPSASPTAFNYLSFPSQLFTCQRYCSKSYPYKTLLGASLGGSFGIPTYAIGSLTNSSLSLGRAQFPREMRQTPQFLEWYSPGDGEIFQSLQNNSASTDVAVPSVTGLDATGFTGLTSNSNFTPGDMYSVEYLAEDGVL